MLKSLKIVFGNLKKDLLRNIIMFIFVALAVCLMNISLSQFMHREYLNNLVKDYGLYEDYMYTAPPAKKAYGDWNSRHSVWENEKQLLDEMKGERYY